MEPAIAPSVNPQTVRRAGWGAFAIFVIGLVAISLYGVATHASVDLMPLYILAGVSVFGTVVFFVAESLDL